MLSHFCTNVNILRQKVCLTKNIGDIYLLRIIRLVTDRMNISTYNNIGIENTLDWARIRKLMIIGMFGAILTFIGNLWTFIGLPAMMKKARQNCRT